MPQDKRYLQRRGEVWYARIIVPPSLRDKLGTHLRKSLKTKSLPEANQRKHAVVGELKRLIQQAKQGASWKDWREELRKAPTQEEREEIELLIGEHAERLAQLAPLGRALLMTITPGTEKQFRGCEGIT